MQIVFTEKHPCTGAITEIFGIDVSAMPCVPRIGEKIILTDFAYENLSKETMDTVEQLICEVYDVCYTKDKIIINVLECNTKYSTPH